MRGPPSPVDGPSASRWRRRRCSASSCSACNWSARTTSRWRTPAPPPRSASPAASAAGCCGCRTRCAGSSRRRRPVPEPAAGSRKDEVAVMSRAESAYYTFREFNSESSREGLRYYLRYFQPAGPAPGAAGIPGPGPGAVRPGAVRPGAPVLELGCGRGEFLDVLAAAGLPGRGVDIDEGMVQQARAAGHEVLLADVVEYLAGQPAGSVPALFCAHLLEHLPAARVAELYTAAGRALAPGAVFVAVVPNAACLSVLGYDFWRDPTHERFYDPLVLAFFAEQAGLAVTETGGNPNNHPGPPPHLVPPVLAGEPPLGEEVGRLVQLAAGRASGGRPWSGQDPAVG